MFVFIYVLLCIYLRRGLSHHPRTLKKTVWRPGRSFKRKRRISKTSLHAQLPGSNYPHASLLLFISRTLLLHLRILQVIHIHALYTCACNLYADFFLKLQSQSAVTEISSTKIKFSCSRQRSADNGLFVNDCRSQQFVRQDHQQQQYHPVEFLVLLVSILFNVLLRSMVVFICKNIVVELPLDFSTPLLGPC